MPRAWKRLHTYSKSALNKLKRKCLTAPSNSSESESELDEDNGQPIEIANRIARDSEQSDGDSEQSRAELAIMETISERESSEDREHQSPRDEIDRAQENVSNSGSDNEYIADNVSDTEASSISSDDADDGIIAAPQQNNEPLYEGAPLTLNESLIATMSMIVRHNMSKEMQADLLKYVELHCPPGNKCKKSLYTFEKQFSKIETPLLRHFYCSVCFHTVDDRKSLCASCVDPTKIDYFLEASIASQLKALYKRPGFRDSLHHHRRGRAQNPEIYSDIYDGAVYQELRENGGFLENPSNISFLMYTDGVHIFKSSKFSIWPVYLVINELPYSLRMRKENILLVALWFGEEKPQPNLFLTPLMESIRELREGVIVEVPNDDNPLTVKGIVICCTCDLPAKALFYNMKQYNGKFGCQKCKQKGETLPHESMRVYPYEPLRLRTDEETDQQAQQAFDAGFAVCGVKGPTVMKYIVHNYMRAIAVDVMHLFEGVVRNLLNFWFSFKFSDHPSSIAEHIDLVDKRLKFLTPPSFVQNLPRSIKNHLAYWKAHELKSWLLYYSLPCINGLLGELYFEHHKLLVLGISLLCRTSIPAETLTTASDALNEYVRRFDVLYHRRHMSNNVHQLLHLPETVRQFGPLWTTSCFPFEDLNGKLKRLVHGSNAAQLQIYAGVSKFLNLASLKDESLVEGRAAHEFCENLDSKCSRMKRRLIANAIYIVGTCTELLPIPPEIATVCQRENINSRRIFYYRKMLKEKILFVSTDYKRSKKTNSSFASYTAQDTITRIGQIRCFIRTADCQCPALCLCLARNFAILRPCVVENHFSTCVADGVLSNIHTILRFEDEEQVIDISNLKSVCFYCKVEDIPDAYVIEPVNSIEFE